MNGTMEHLSEDERQMLADGTLEPERLATATAHLQRCTDCTADVDRIRAFMMRTSDMPSRADSLEELWPAIRARIEQNKVVAIAPGESGSATVLRTRGRIRLWTGVTGGAAAAAVVALILLPGRDRVSVDFSVNRERDTTRSFVAAIDSARTYEAEAQTLLDRLELQRAVMRPEAAQLLERDLRSIDVAIVELKDAIARDPRNATLRQLLASSYRQKIELLKRANNAI
jgi:hypothetical protein